MTRLALLSFVLASTSALLPSAAQANPTALAVLRTVAVTSDPGVAQAEAAPVGTTTTNRVTVEVSTESAPQPSPAVATPPAPVPAPTVEPPLPHLAGYKPPPYSEQIYQDRKSGGKLLAAGLTLGTSAYLFSSLAGALAIDRAEKITDDPLTEADEGRERERRRAYGRALLVPGIGPFIAIARADTAMRGWGAGLAGLTQAVAVGLTLAGAHRLARARRLQRSSWSAMASGQEAHVAVRWRF